MGSEHGDVHWSELMTSDPEGAEAFYCSILSWQIQQADMGEAGIYRVAMRGEAPLAGIFAMEGPEFEGVPDHWMTYFAVSDADAAAAAITSAGGQVLRPPFDVPEVGRICVFRDVGGAMVGVIQPTASHG